MRASETLKGNQPDLNQQAICRVGPGSFTPSPSQNSGLEPLDCIRLVPSDEGCRPPSKPAGSSCCQLAHYGSDVDGLPASLHGHYSASSLSGRRRRAYALTTVRRSNCTYSFPVCSFHEDSATLICE
jgi:hypothetical protein